MPAIVYPDTLPEPSSAPVTPFERRRLTGLPGFRNADVRQRDFGATQQLTWPAMMRAEFAELMEWYSTDLIEGAAWFASAWPHPQGEVTAVRKFLGAPARQYLGADLWRVSAEFEVRGAGELPNTSEVVVPVLLLHFDGTEGSTAIVDSSPAARTVTVNGNAQITNTGPRFGSGAMLCDLAGDWVTVPDSVDFDFTEGDFCIELFVFSTKVSATQKLVIKRTPAAAEYPIDLEITSGNLLRARGTDSDANPVFTIADSVAFPTSAWTHVALTKSGSDYRLFKGGVQVGSTVTNATPLAASTGLVSVASSQDGETSFTGRLDELRIARVAVYTADFLPPEEAFPNS